MTRHRLERQQDPISVGSLLRTTTSGGSPPDLRRGHTTLHQEEREKDRGRLRELEDDAIRQAVARRDRCGARCGHRRRVSPSALHQLVLRRRRRTRAKSPPAIFYGDDGSEVEHPGPALVGRRLRKIDGPAAREASFLAAVTDRPFKVTFPAASWFCFQSLRAPAIRSGSICGSADEVLADTVEILRELATDTVNAGARELQFDEPAYAFLLAPTSRSFSRRWEAVTSSCWSSACKLTGNSSSRSIRPHDRGPSLPR